MPYVRVLRPIRRVPVRLVFRGMGAITPSQQAAMNAFGRLSTAQQMLLQDQFSAALAAGTATPDMAAATGYNPAVVSGGKWNGAAAQSLVNGLAPGDPGYADAVAAASMATAGPSANPSLLVPAVTIQSNAPAPVAIAAPGTAQSNAPAPAVVTPSGPTTANWFDGIPNWALLAGAAGIAALFFFGRRK
jgi:hypothetical protein